MLTSEFCTNWTSAFNSYLLQLYLLNSTKFLLMSVCESVKNIIAFVTVREATVIWKHAPVILFFSVYIV